MIGARGENNGLAGIEGIVELQKCPSHRDIPIFMYIGDKMLAKAKITQNKEKLKNIHKKLIIGFLFRFVSHNK